MVPAAPRSAAWGEHPVNARFSVECPGNATVLPSIGLERLSAYLCTLQTTWGEAGGVQGLCAVHVHEGGHGATVTP